jgi:hypothetical protein
LDLEDFGTWGFGIKRDFSVVSGFEGFWALRFGDLGGFGVLGIWDLNIFLSGFCILGGSGLCGFEYLGVWGPGNFDLKGFGTWGFGM